MVTERSIAAITRLSTASLGVFRGCDAVELGVSRKQLASLRSAGVIQRELPDVYRMNVVQRSAEQRLRAALLWAGDASVGAGLSAGQHYKLERVHAAKPEIIVPKTCRVRSPHVVVHHHDRYEALMVRRVRGVRVTGVEATLVALGAALEPEAFEIACEDARRRELTAIPALRAYLDQYGRKGLPGATALRMLLAELDPVFPSRSALEVKTRRLLVAHGFTDFRREFPLEWNGRVHRFDFAFESTRIILETNGRRWHDDAADYEHDNEKWSVPGRHGYRVVFATWRKVTRHPQALLREIGAAIAA